LGDSPLLRAFFEAAAIEYGMLVSYPSINALLFWSANMNIKILMAAIVASMAAPAIAGSDGPPAMEPTVIIAEDDDLLGAGAGTAGPVVVGAILLGLIALAANDDT